MCDPILYAMAQFESQELCTLFAFDKLEELFISFEANALTVVVMDKFHHDCDDLILDNRRRSLSETSMQALLFHYYNNNIWLKSGLGLSWSALLD